MTDETAIYEIFFKVKIIYHCFANILMELLYTYARDIAYKIVNSLSRIRQTKVSLSNICLYLAFTFDVAVIRNVYNLGRSY